MKTSTQRLVAALLAGALLSGTGCFNHYAIPTSELPKLDGFDVPPPSPGRAAVQPHRLLQSDDGSTVTFDAGTELFLRTAAGRSGGKFRQIRITPTAFDGVLANPPQPLHLDLTSIQGAEATALDGGRTAALVLGSGAVAILLLLGVGVAGVLNLG